MAFPVKLVSRDFTSHKLYNSNTSSRCAHSTVCYLSPTQTILSTQHKTFSPALNAVQRYTEQYTEQYMTVNYFCLYYRDSSHNLTCVLRIVNLLAVLLHFTNLLYITYWVKLCTSMYNFHKNCETKLLTFYVVGRQNIHWINT